MLAEGFVISTRSFDSFAAAYAYGSQQKLPAFITTDTILDAFQIVVDITWQRSEGQFLAADLMALSHAMVAVSQQQWEEAEDDSTAQAAQRNLAFFAVGSRLLDPQFTLPPLVSSVASDELTLIEQGGRFISPLFGGQYDYNRFSPSIHYAKDEALSRYFRALTWLSQPFPLEISPMQSGAAVSGTAALSNARLTARQALLIAWGLQESNNLSRWERIFQPALYFNGAAVAWGLPQVQVAANALYGDNPSPADLANEAIVDDFLATIHTMPPLLTFDPAPQPAFMLLPAPTATQPDSAILRQLTFNRIGEYSGEPPLPRSAVETAIGAIRGLPRTLDVPAALGSSLAQNLVAEAGDDDYDGYTLQFQELQQHYAAIEQQAWTTSFDGAWLYALQSLLTEIPEDGVLYAPSDAWQARQFNTWHAAWIALRHETELAPRPVTAVATSPDVSQGYLEPQPLLYGRLASLADQILDGLGSRGLLDEESASKLLQLERLLETAETISRKELAGEPLAEDEALLLSQFISRLVNLTTYAPAAFDAAAQTAPGLARLADVYLDAGSGKVLQAATGETWPIYVLIPREEGVILTMGAIFSTYELHGEQLAPGVWRQMETRPPPPPWTQPFVAPE